MLRYILAIACLAVVSCDDDTSMPAQPTADLAVAFDLQMPDLAARYIPDQGPRLDGGLQCGTQTCGSGQICCQQVGVADVCGAPGSCPDGGVVAACDGPEDCPASTAGCCVSADLNVPAIGSTSIQVGNSSCTNGCDVTLDLSTNLTTTQMCHTPSDCAHTSGIVLMTSEAFDGCCTGPGLNGARICVPLQFSASLQMTCN